MIVLCIPSHLIEDRLIPVFAVAMAMFILAGAVWSFIDCILLLCKVFTDSQGHRLTKWVHSDATSSTRPPLPQIRRPVSGDAATAVRRGDRCGRLGGECWCRPILCLHFAGFRHRRKLQVRVELPADLWRGCPLGGNPKTSALPAMP